MLVIVGVVGWVTLDYPLMLAAIRIPEAGGAAVGLLGVCGLYYLVRRVLFKKRASAPAPVSPEQDHQYLKAASSSRVSRLMRAIVGRLRRKAVAQDVDVSVFAPSWAPPRHDVVIQVIFYTPDREAEVQAKALRIDPSTEHLAAVPLQLQVREADQLKATIECKDLRLNAPTQTARWNGRMICMQFLATLPDATANKMLRPTLRVFVNGIPAGTVLFKLTVVPGQTIAGMTMANESAKAFQRPFLSYATEDRVSVLRAAQLLGVLGMNYFQDVLSLSPGDRWERKLYAEIDKCDLFLLFWSRSARNSKWVIMEAEYALKRAREKQRSGEIEIVPVLLEGPPAPVPPLSLSEIHFNDPIRHVIFAEETLAKTQAPAAAKKK